MQRGDIIQAAAQIFRLKGYHATSMQDIADAVHLQKASLYHHVESKQDILISILDQALDLMIADLEHVLASTASPTERLREAVRGYVSYLVEQGDLAAVLIFEHRSLDVSRRKAHLGRRDRFEALWRLLLTEGVQAGSFRQMDVPIVASSLLSVMNGMLGWYKKDGRLKPVQIADAISDVFLQGIARSENSP